MKAARQALETVMAVRGKVDSHPGLLLQRYLHESSSGEGGKPEEKRAILLAAINASANEETRVLYRKAFERWSASLLNNPAPLDVETTGRLIVGLGSENVLETGIRLHHTYGMPIIPGSALKGLAAHYCDQVWGADDRRYKKPIPAEDEAYRKFLAGRAPKPEDSFHRLLFGSTDDGGCILFHDAWHVPDSSPAPLVLDVMTPHHPKWNDISKPVAPTDFDSPIPVPFLSVTGTFRVAVSWRGPDQRDASNWTKWALDLLCEALCDWGIGGKTSSGYGRFDREKLEAARKEQEVLAARIRREQGEQAKLAAMTPVERDIKEYLDSHPDKAAKDYMKLLKELEKADGRFRTPEDRRAVADRVKAGMLAEKVWKDKEPHGKRKKFIEGILAGQP